jgi:type IV secretion system protein TrbL
VRTKHQPAQMQSPALAQPKIKNGDLMNRNKSVLVTGALLLLFSTGTWAAELTSTGVLDKVIARFSEKAPTWESEVHSAALYLFLALATMNMVWTFKEQIWKLDFSGIMAEAIRFGVVTCFFLFLLDHGPAIAMTVIDSLRKLAGKAMGLNNSISPSDIVDIGFLIWKQAISNLSGWSPIDSFIGIILSMLILIILATIAVNMTLLLISTWILAYAGQFLLAFGGSSWTSDMAINYLKTVLNVAIQLFVMTLLIGVGNDLLTEFYDKMNKGRLDFEQLGIMLVFCLSLVMLVDKVPSMVAGIVSGGGSAGGIGSISAGATIGAAMTAVSMGGAAMAKAGGALLSAATSAAGIMDAAKAASEGGGDSGGTGGSSMDSGSSIMNTDPQSSKGSDTPQKSGGDQLAAAMGLNDTGSRQSSPGNQSSSMGSRLASGIKSVAQSKAGEIKQNLADKVSQTTGGQIASTIRASDAAAKTAGTDSNDTYNSLSAGSEKPSPPDPSEFDDFVNRRD